MPSLVAGLSAVAQLSMLSDPGHSTVAVSRDNWNSARQQARIELVPMREEDTIDVEVWVYPPGILSDGGTVDPLSLYLAIEEMADERVETAIERILEDLPW